MMIAERLDEFLCDTVDKPPSWLRLLIIKFIDAIFPLVLGLMLIPIIIFILIKKVGKGIIHAIH